MQAAAPLPFRLFHGAIPCPSPSWRFSDPATFEFLLQQSFHMTDTTAGLPMDVAEEARLQQQQQQQDEDHNKELHRNDSVRARLLAISQVEPVGEVLPLDALKDTKGAPPPTHSPADNEDEFRRKLVSISYVDVPMSAQ